MAKRGSPKQWLNIIIIVISALILAFALIGKLMNRPSKPVDRVTTSEQQPYQQDSPEGQVQPPHSQKQFSLTKLDFGSLQLTKKERNHSVVWQQNPKALLSDQQLKQVIRLWQQLLSTPVAEVNVQPENYLPVATVLLSFSGSSSPIIVKIAQSKSEQNKLLINFVSTGQQIILSNTSLQHILPKSNNS